MTSDWLWGAKGAPVSLFDRETDKEVRPVVIDENTGHRLDVRRLKVARSKRPNP